MAQSNVLAVIVHEGVTVSYRLTTSSTLLGLKQFICQRFPSLNPDSFSLSFSLNEKIKDLDTDAYIMCMAWYFCSQCIPTVDLHLLLNNSVRDIICHDDGELIDTCKDNEVCQEVVPTPFSIQQGLKSAGWGKVFSCVRQVFDGGAEEFRQLLVLYSIETGFSYIFKKNDRKRVTVVCKKKVDKGCAWMIHSVLKGGIFSIEKMN
ncbi:Zinc finger protein, partial [Thalictrum thalictroides]